jgi:hypothetical protein
MAQTPSIESLARSLAASPRQYGLYAGLYLVSGLVMNTIGKWLEIAEFNHWWQVVTCYVLYLAPASLLVREKTFFDQYLRGLLTLAPLEILGYALGTSRAFDNNLIDRVLGERNFTLAMVVFFGLTLPAGNAAVAWLDARFSRPEPSPDEAPNQ